MLEHYSPDRIGLGIILCSQICSCEFPPATTGIHQFQRVGRIPLNRKQLKTGDFGRRPETALGAGGPAFKSRRPDHNSSGA
jgi:hypothetical protein